MENIIESCVRNHVRFPFRGHAAATEDMFDLTADQLNGVYVTIQAQLKGRADTLTQQESPEDAMLRMKAEAVRYIYNLKVAEAQAAETALAKAQEKRRLEKALLRKKEDKINAMPEEEIQQLISSL